MKFFLGIRLPEELEETCERYRRAFQAPKTIAHITVIAPFDWEQTKQDLDQLLRAALANTEPFTITGEGLGSFGTRVLFVNVLLTPQLKALHYDLARQLQMAGIVLDSRPYSPHITLATRLRASQFKQYKEQLMDFTPQYAFCCSQLSIFQFTSGGWKESGQVAL